MIQVMILNYKIFLIREPIGLRQLSDEFWQTVGAKKGEIKI